MSGHALDPGKGTTVAPSTAQIIAQGAAVQAEPGKQTLTGNRLVDHGAVCDNAPNADGCFLPAQQRGYLVAFYVGRVDDAAGVCRQALSNLRMDTLLEKDADNNFPLIANLILEFIGGYALTTVTNAVRTLRKASDAKISEIQKLLRFEESKQAVALSPMQAGLLQLTETAVPVISKQIVDKVKKGVPQLVAPVDADGKKQAVAYIELLMDQAAFAFQELREQAPGLASDSQMIALWDGFDPKNHRTSQYQHQLHGKLERFVHSNVTSIGRDKGERHVDEGDRPSDPAVAVSPRSIRDVVVVRATFESGARPSYALASTWWRAAAKPFDGYMGVQLDEPLPMVKGWFKDAPMVQTGTQVLGMIDPEFAEIAVARHMQMWGAAPESMHIDDSTWFWDPPRAERAMQNKMKEQPGVFRQFAGFGFGAPRKTSTP